MNARTFLLLGLAAGCTSQGNSVDALCIDLYERCLPTPVPGSTFEADCVSQRLQAERAGCGSVYADHMSCATSEACGSTACSAEVYVDCVRSSTSEPCIARCNACGGDSCFSTCLGGDRIAVAAGCVDDQDRYLSCLGDHIDDCSPVPADCVDERSTLDACRDRWLGSDNDAGRTMREP